MGGGEWATQKELKQRASDARELLREQVRLEKRLLRDLRYCVERSTLTAQEWRDLLSLHQDHGKEGLRQLWEDLIPYWDTCQRMNGGESCPNDIKPAWVTELSAKIPRTNPTTRKLPGSPRKPRTDKGKQRGPYKIQA
jgi:hypothetical protein